MAYIETGFAIGTPPKSTTVPRTPDLDAEFPMPTALQQLAVKKGTSVTGSSFLDRLASGAGDILKSLTGKGASNIPTQTPPPSNYTYAPSASISSSLGGLTTPLLLVGGAAAVYFLVIKKRR